MSSVSGIIKAIQDIMRKDAGVDGDAQRISQLTWMLFLKILDDREVELEILDDDGEFKSPVPEHLRWRNWAADSEGITGDALLDFINSQLFPNLQSKMPTQGDVGKRGQVIRDVFEDTNNYMKSGTLMRQVVNKINKIDFNSSDDRHMFGDIYEQILRDLQSAGNAGEFYTPRAVTEFIVNRVNPRLGEKIFDPACGTGGFLVNAIEHIRDQDVKTADDEVKLAKSISGVEKKPLPYMLCVTNAILHGIDTPTGIRHDNTLETPYRDYSDKDRVDVIITNPPFGGMEEDGIEDNFPKSYRTRETADLFMALILRLLKKHGRAAIVLPDGFFFGEGVKTRLKEALVTECNLHTIVRLPGSVFAPYTNIKTNILFFTKGEQTKDIWFYEHNMPAGIKAYNKTRPIKFEEFEPLIKWWGTQKDGFKARKSSMRAWKVSKEYIEKRGYNLDVPNPTKIEAHIRSPNEILPKYKITQERIKTVSSQLKGTLSEALDKSTKTLVIENLDVWLTAGSLTQSAGRGSKQTKPGIGINSLRMIILDLAVTGKLVKPLKGNSSDEDVDTLTMGFPVKRKHVRLLKDSYKVGSSAPYPPHWKFLKLGEISEYIQRGKGPKYDPKGEVRIVSQKCIQSSGFDVSAARYISKESFEKFGAERHLQTGDILWNSTGTGTVGRTNILPEITDKVLVADSHVTIIRLPHSITHFMHLFLLSNYVQSRIDRRNKDPLVSGTTNQVELNTSSVVNLPVPFPPIEEQNRIVFRVKKLMALIDDLEVCLNTVEALKSELAESVLYFVSQNK